jgi:hypothetical protein
MEVSINPKIPVIGLLPRKSSWLGRLAAGGWIAGLLDCWICGFVGGWEEGGVWNGGVRWKRPGKMPGPLLWRRPQTPLATREATFFFTISSKDVRYGQFFDMGRLRLTRRINGLLDGWICGRRSLRSYG